MKKIITILLLALTINAYAQEDKTVTLVVSGQGKTQDEAKLVAFRSAIEQAFGAFISSKTEILNDSLVKDEIVSVSSGNIQNFEIISVVQLPGGDFATTLSAVVSISKLTTFCESKGVEVEFKGGLFAANIKIQKLNDDNEMKAINHISHAVKQMSSNLWSYDLTVADPILDRYTPGQWIINCETVVTPTKNLSIMNEYIYKSLMEIRMKKEEIEKYKILNIPVYKLILIKPTVNLEGDGIKEDLNIRDDYNDFYSALKLDGKNEDLKTKDALYKEQGEIIFLRNIKSLAILQDLVEYLNYSIGNFAITDNIDTINMVETIERNFNIQNKNRFQCKYNWHFTFENYWEFDYYKGAMYKKWNYGWTKEAISYHYKNKVEKLLKYEKEIDRRNNLKEKDPTDIYYIEKYNDFIKETKEELFYFYDSTKCYCAPKTGDGSFGDVYRKENYSGYVGGLKDEVLWINLNLYTTPIASIIFEKSVNEVHLEKIQEFRVFPMNLIEIVK